jgi:HAD superfamily hydrolase (TIGR01490 family)
MRERIEPMIRDSARALVERHRGEVCVIITATNSFVTGPIALALGVEHLIATDPQMSNGEFTGREAGTPCFLEGKVERLRAWLDERGTALESFAESWFYSDSLNDLPLLCAVSHPVAVDPDDTLDRHARERGWPIISLKSARC